MEKNDEWRKNLCVFTVVILVQKESFFAGGVAFASTIDLTVRRTVFMAV